MALTEGQAVSAGAGIIPISIPYAPWILLAVDGVLADVLDLTDSVIQAALGTNLTELTGDWEYTQAQGQVSPTQTLGQLAYDSGTITAFQYVSAKNPFHGKGIAVFIDRLARNPANYVASIDPRGFLAQRLP